MTKKYEREEKLTEQLQKENRELKAINRSLRKRLKQLNKGFYKFLDEQQQEEAIEEAQQVAQKICWECNIGEYKEIIVVNRRWRCCTNCGKKGKVSIIK